MKSTGQGTAKPFFEKKAREPAWNSCAISRKLIVTTRWSMMLKPAKILYGSAIAALLFQGADLTQRIPHPSQHQAELTGGSEEAIAPPNPRSPRTSDRSSVPCHNCQDQEMGLREVILTEGNPRRNDARTLPQGRVSFQADREIFTSRRDVAPGITPNPRPKSP